MSNAFQDLADTGSQAASAAAADAMGDIARDGDVQRVTVTAERIKGSDGSFNQNERLFVARSRSALVSNQNNSDGSDKAGSRGQWAFIKLLTSQEQAKGYYESTTTRPLSPKARSLLLGEEGLVTKMINTTEDKTTGGYDGFLLTGVSCQLSEKVQITEVFGDNEVIYYFGRDPMVFSISGILIDSPDNNWFTDWLYMYSNFMRGTQLAKNAELLQLVLPNMTLLGTISSFAWNQDASRDVDIPFTFQFLAKEILPTPATGKIQSTNQLASLNFDSAANFLGQSGINTLKAQMRAVSDLLMSPLSTLAQKAGALGMVGTGLGGSFGSMLEGARGTMGQFQSTIAGWDKARASFFDSVTSSSLFQSASTALLGIRLNLFAPVYGVLSSLTKLVTNAFASTLSLINSVVNPIRNMLRDITTIANQAVSLVNLVQGSISGIGRAISGGLAGIGADFDEAVRSLGRASGAIATAPVTVAQSVSLMFKSSQLTADAPFLQTSPKLSFARPVLPLGSAPPPTKASLMAGIAPLNVKKPVL